MWVTADNYIDFGTLGRHYPVHVESGMTQDNNDVHASGSQSFSFGIHRLDFVQESQISGTG